MKKQDKNRIELIDGQISIFDIQVAEKPKKVAKVESSVTKSSDFITESQESFTNDVAQITEKQQKIIDKFKATQVVNRIIIYAKGSIGIEIKEAGFATHYINRDGKEECSINAKSPVLPWDQIIYYMQGKVPLTKEQVDKLQTLLSKHRESINRVIHRKGDENILIEAQGKIIDILPNGWVIEFESLDNIQCTEDEVYMIPEKIPQKVKEEDPGEIQKKVKIGDYVQAMYGKELIEGELFSEYNSGCTFSIIFKNGTKHTAIPKIAITKILKSA